MDFNNEDTIRWKIDRLLVENPKFFHEQRLAVLLLCTRLSDASSVVERHPELITFAVHLLQDIHEEVYLRLAAQFMSRIGSSSVNIVQRCASALGHELLLRLRRRKCDRSIVDLEILSSLQGYFAAMQSQARLLDAKLIDLWEIIVQDTSPGKHGGYTATTTTETSNDNAQLLMIQTITALLDQTTSIDESSGDIEALWIAHSTHLVWTFCEYLIQQQYIPSIFQKILQWWVADNQSTQENRRHWAKVLFLCAQQMAELSTFQKMLRSDANTASCLARFILASVVSTSSDELRTMAWSTTANVLNHCGWDWLWTNQTNGTLGSAQTIGTMIRLASGEFKIQLNISLHSDDINDSVLRACAQVLVCAVDFVVQIADQANDHKLPLSADAILHLRQSLEDTLNSASEYLCLSQQRNDTIDVAVVEVFSALLAEFDIFESSEAENPYLDSVRIVLAMPHTNFKFLPALASILSAAQNDKYRVDTLKENGVLGDSLRRFLERTWINITNYLDSIQWACEVTELFWTMSDVAISSTLEHAVISWIESSLEERPSKELANVLPSVIACFTTLHGDEYPDDRDATILQNALEFCARFDSRIEM